MTLDRKERFLIANQFKILEALYPKEAADYAACRMVFEEGYESEYEDTMNHISNEIVAAGEANEVINTLDMFSAIRRSAGNLSDKNSVNEFGMKFRGYDGNHPTESRLMGYARFTVIDKRRFSEIMEGQEKHFDFNSHSEMLGMYGRMLEVWNKIPIGTQLGQRHNLTGDQLIQLDKATIHPSNRAGRQ